MARKTKEQASAVEPPVETTTKRTRKVKAEPEPTETQPVASQIEEKPKRTRKAAPKVADAVVEPKAKAPVKKAPPKSKVKVQEPGTSSLIGDQASALIANWRSVAPTSAPVSKTETAKPVRARGKSSKSAAPSSIPVSDAEGRLTIAEWRVKGSAPKPASAEEETPSEVTVKQAKEPRGKRQRPVKGDLEVEVVEVQTTEEIGEVTFRTRKFRDRAIREDRKEKTKGKPEPVSEPVSKEPELPPAPVREQIDIPENAPQVVIYNGQPVIIKDRKVIPPLWFFANAVDSKRIPTVLEEAKLASDNKIHTYSFLVDLEADVENVARSVEFSTDMTAKLVELDPDCQVILRISFGAAAGWDRKFPRARYLLNSGGVGEPSVCDDEFWSAALASLEKFIEAIQASPLKDHVLGLHLERGEWFFGEGWGYDTSEAATDKFREWLRHRYRNDVVTLRASWFEGDAQFATVAIPDYREKSGTGDEFVRTGRKARRWVDYHLFLSDATTDRISQLAYEAKRKSGGEFLIGVSYGYTFEWSHPASGHLALGKLLRSPDIDYIAGPPSYKNREPGGTAPVPAPIDSFALNGKLYVSEEDYKTPMSGREEPDDYNPVMKTPQALESVHWRGAGAALAHRSGVCWMDSWGNGWLNSRGIWQRAQTIAESMIGQVHTKPVGPDVAVFIDERSLAYLVDERAFGILVQNVRESVLRSGLSVGFYLLSDLAHRENFPESKLYVFANAWDIRPEVRSAIKSRLQRENKVLFWLYAAGLFEGGRESLERVREVTGIALRPQPFNSKPGTAILNPRNPLCQSLPEKQLLEGGQLEPSYFAIPENASILGEYAQTGLPSFVVRKFEPEDNDGEGWTSVFLGEPVVTPALFRSLGEMAGAHVWSFSEDLVHVGEPFLTVHCRGTGNRTIALPDKYSAYNLNMQEWAAVDGNSIRFPALDGSTHTFLVGLKSEIEAILSERQDGPIEVTGDLRSTENTVHWELIKFDVPIMKLDEWVEESWTEDHADDLLIKPSQFEVDLTSEYDEPELPKSRGGGRRRRRRRDASDDRSYGGRRGETDQPSGDPDVINFMFRKRE